MSKRFTYKKELEVNKGYKYRFINVYDKFGNKSTMGLPLNPNENTAYLSYNNERQENISVDEAKRRLRRLGISTNSRNKGYLK